MRRLLLGACVFAASLTAGRMAEADPAYLGLTAQSLDMRIYAGGGLEPIYAYVYNQADAGANALNYTLQYSFPNGSTVTYLNQSRAADGGSDYDQFTQLWNTAGYAPGAYTTVITATDPNALNSPQSAEVEVTIVQHGKVEVADNGVPLAEPSAAEPGADPLAFGATGGGESFAAPLTGFGDPVGPAGMLDIDSIIGVGDPQITTDLTPLTGLFDDNIPADGDPFNILVDASTPGTYSKIFYLFFSDEQDIPGAYAPGSELYEFEVWATVANVDGQTVVTGNVAEVPEPASILPMLLGMAVLVIARPAGRIRVG